MTDRQQHKVWQHCPVAGSVAAKARQQERERIAKQIEHNASNRKYHSYLTSMQIVEYLRGERP